MQTARNRVLMIYPAFNANSFWNYKATCALAGARHPAAPLGLITVAALLPTTWEVRLVDLNTEELGAQDLDWADLVMTGGMLPQQDGALAVIEMCRSRGKPVVVGGPDATSTPDIYAAADFQVLGEAEEIMADFVAAWTGGARSGVFRAEMGKTDVTRSPTPRFDLLTFKNYLHVGVQFSRGCPFNCEFCDIIELYGRVPRTKTNAQVMAELDTLHALGYRGHVDFVDDNLIGNKKALRQFLPALTDWMREKNSPFEFSTEASINLADDPALMEAMSEANFFTIFVGIESPDADTLVLTQKKQNTRRSLAESVHKIYRAGLFVNAGFILGFDSEKGSVARGMIDCIEDTAIPVCMVGLLYALPNTQLTRRLDREGRLVLPDDADRTQGLGDQCTAGLNFVTSRPRRAILSDYKAVLEAVYAPSAFFGRVRRVGRMLDCTHRRLELPRSMEWQELKSSWRLFWQMTVAKGGVRREFWKTVLDCLVHNRQALPYALMMMALYLHLGPFSRHVIAQLQRQIDNLPDTQPAALPARLELSKAAVAVPA
ncbi:putative enzyme [Bosea sp. 62]|uniref:B12-binding domain-containing radical SAM protein n=1 Tax=unclassified Bosea (in: a-proteobacteria) TaxID=2653178 RepID=UPI00125B0B5C|nr:MULTISPECIES: B12-binding domain-containing radical SAM protein [unclassified Bosea (in: a-proteobacteria)]CAD5250454.1 putative enzyme [Bosea sp. 7B]CAD5281616.1 putative enzyme [Bosea sp. 21B]CAD5283283.1 putative enzyme [Bosea sp. 46]VVT52423.1 putative enzyme [Bosea sp. EC-HK365B]VXB23782.1 putative enzyme [Bosea sp. 62]